MMTAYALKVIDYQFENGGPLGAAKTIYEHQAMVRFGGQETPIKTKEQQGKIALGNSN